MTAAVLPRFGAFVLARFTPPVYVSYAVLWTLAFEASMSFVDGEPWRPGWPTAARAAAMVLALLFLRMLDELKDLAYDREHNPDRPLVTGVITAAELKAAMTLSAAAGLLLAWTSAWVYAAALGYGLLLAGIERAVPRICGSVLLNLVITYPVQLVLGTFLAVSAGAPASAAIPLLAIFAGVFLHFEFARKTTRHVEPGTRTYASVLGPAGAATAALLCAAVAEAVALATFHPWSSGPTAWLVPAAALAPCLGAAAFFRGRVSWPVGAAMAFVLVSYVGLVVQAL